PLPGALAPTPDEATADLGPTSEHVPYLEPVEEKKDSHEPKPGAEEDVIDIPVEQSEVLETLPAEEKRRKGKKKAKRPRPRPTSAAANWRVRYGMEADPDNPDRGVFFWSPARIGGLVSVILALSLFVVWFVLLDRWDDDMTSARRSVLWLIVGGGFGFGLYV